MLRNPLQGRPASLSPTSGTESSLSNEDSAGPEPLILRPPSGQLDADAAKKHKLHHPSVQSRKQETIKMAGLMAGQPESNNNNSSNIGPHKNGRPASASQANGRHGHGGGAAGKGAPGILVKYNYYDCNGDRREQTNQDASMLKQQQQQLDQHNQQRVLSQLSPTFKQSLDQIVRNQQQHLGELQQQQQQGGQQAPNGGLQASCSPPAAKSPHFLQLARRYQLASYEQRCLRCRTTVYQMDKVGPLKEFTFYHQNCFKCRECGTKLTLKTYFNNQQSSEDLEVYCHRHCPKTGPGRLDNQSVGIRTALNAPKVFEASLSAGQLHCLGLADLGQASHGPLSPRSTAAALAANAVSPIQAGDWPAVGGQSAPSVDSRALHIQHAVQQTRLQAIYKHSQVDKKISQFLNRRLEYLEPKQKMLEMRHREEEDALFKAFEQKWRQEEGLITEQIRDEWQKELGKLLDKYKRQLSSGFAGAPADPLVAGHEHGRLVAAAVAVAAAAPAKHEAASQPASANNKQQMIEYERLNLEKTMTIKLDRKKETLKRKLKEFERQATAELVEKQSREMLALISLKLDEFKEEQRRKIDADLEQFEAIETLANQLGSSLQLAEAVAGSAPDPATKARPKAVSARAKPLNGEAARAQTADAPKPRPPLVSKMELYNSEQPDEVFRDIDERAINVARDEQRTFTDLVHHLTRHCLTDIEKARAIFRWITVKNLNTMHFDSSVKPDTPLGLLRGIKNGSESYHVLFKRLCSYAGLHCVVIKGYSKSAGYQPGVQFEGNRFRNSWNAVYVAGAWRFVQCNWGARHLVSVAVMQDKSSTGNSPASQEGGVQHREQPLRASAHVATTAGSPAVVQPNGGVTNMGRAQLQQHQRQTIHLQPLVSPNHGRRGPQNGHQQQQQQQLQFEPAQLEAAEAAHFHRHRNHHHHHHHHQHEVISPKHHHHHHHHPESPPKGKGSPTSSTSTSIHSHSSSAYSPSSSSSLNGAGNGSPASAPHSLSPASLSPPSELERGARVSRSGAPKQPLHQQQGAANGKQQQQPLANGNNRAKLASANDSLRYEYDDHYFLTDPEEFIYEFFPLEPDWQLIKTRPINLAEFEQLPFVRSLFFKYGLYFPQPDIRSVLQTDSSGATTIKIGMPTHMVPSLIFHYNLKHYDSDSENYEGVSLKRFVMQSVESGTADSSASLSAANGHNAATPTSGPTHTSQGHQTLLSNIVSFRVHLPANGAYILDIFANSTTPAHYITGEPMKFKSVCKFKIVAKNLKTVMIPLPDCASGEFGPMKATRLFGIIPITHESGLIVVQNDKRFLEIQFRMTRPLSDFMATLHKNGYDERQLSKSVSIFIDDDIVIVTIKFFEDGQYGLDIYTRDHKIAATSAATAAALPLPNKDHPSSHGHKQQARHTAPLANQTTNHPAEQITRKQLLTHCCKYLINVRTPNNR